MADEPDIPNDEEVDPEQVQPAVPADQQADQLEHEDDTGTDDDQLEDDDEPDAYEGGGEDEE